MPPLTVLGGRKAASANISESSTIIKNQQCNSITTSAIVELILSTPGFKLYRDGHVKDSTESLSWTVGKEKLPV